LNKLLSLYNSFTNTFRLREIFERWPCLKTGVPQNLFDKAALNYIR